MAQPKKNFIPIRMKDKAYGNNRRINYVKEIQYKETEFPKPLTYSDIDAAFEEFAKNEVANLEGLNLPVYTLYSNQRYSEYTQTWKHTDKEGNLIMNFITVNRDNNPKPGTNQGELWNIPGNRKYVMNVKNVLDDNGTESYEVFSMRQPFCVDLSYRISVMTLTNEHINLFNNKINDLFKSRQHYIRPNGHFIPMVIDSVDDETQYSIDDRRFFVQSITIKVMAYIINEEDFKVDRLPKRVILSTEGDAKKKKAEVNIDEYDDSVFGTKAVELSVDFKEWSDKVEFDIDTSFSVENVEMENVLSYRLFINDMMIYTEKGFKFSDGDNVKIKIKKFYNEDVSLMVFKGHDENTKYLKDYVPENVSDEPDESVKREVIVVE